MASLVMEFSGLRRAGKLSGRVLIGRRLIGGIVVNDPSVSRLHAWIEYRDGIFTLTDAGSRNGTFLNGDAVVRSELADGDRIQIGPAKLIFRTGSELPDGVETLQLSDDGGAIESSAAGILFNCACGAPLWVGSELAGREGLCKYCGERVRVPRSKTPPRPKLVRPAAAISLAPPDVTIAEKPRQSSRQRPAQPTPKPRPVCGICHTPIGETELTTTCPSCGLVFHGDCWQENLGCSAYGCPQVNVLKQPEPIAPAGAGGDTAAPTKPVIPWDLLLLAGSMVASLAGALLFGSLALLIAVIELIRLLRGHSRQKPLLIGALILAILGTAAGVILSDIWWFNSRHLHQYGW